MNSRHIRIGNNLFQISVINLVLHLWIRYSGACKIFIPSDNRIHLSFLNLQENSRIENMLVIRFESFDQEGFDRQFSVSRPQRFTNMASNYFIGCPQTSNAYKNKVDIARYQLQFKPKIWELSYWEYGTQKW